LNPAATLKTETIVSGLAPGKNGPRYLIDLLVAEKNKRLIKTARGTVPPVLLETGSTWELTLLRVPQRTVDDLLDTPYKVYLTSINKLNAKAEARSLSGIVDIEIFNVGGQFSTAVENGVIKKVSGTARTNIKITISIRGDSTVVLNAGPTSLPINDQVQNVYSGTVLNLVADGVLVQRIQSGVGPDPAVFSSSGVFTGLAAWEEIFYRTETVEGKIFNGHGPVKIKFGAAKFQRSELFPEF